MSRPAELPVRGSQAWRRLDVRLLFAAIVQAGRDLFIDGGPQVAAAMAYYALLSTLPLMLAVAALAAFFIDPNHAVEQVTALTTQFAPEDATPIIQLVPELIRSRRGLSIVSLLVLLWTGSRICGVITKALNLAFGFAETYGYVKRTLLEILMLVTLGASFVLALASRTLLSMGWQLFRGSVGPSTVVSLAIGQLLPVGLLLATFFCLYHVVPRGHSHWAPSAVGACIATGLFALARLVFWNYARRFGAYNLLYGSVTVLIMIVIWTWLVAMLMLLGGEVAGHLQAMMVAGRSRDEVAAEHRERSFLYRCPPRL